MRMLQSALVGTLLASALVLPDPESLVMFLGAAGLGIGIGASAGYTVFLQRTGAARVKAYKEMDEARRESTLGKLEEANEENQHLRQRMNEVIQEVDVFRHELQEERDLNAKLRNDLMDFALRVLAEKGHIAKPIPSPTPEDTRS
jgi:hypothetical protein